MDSKSFFLKTSRSVIYTCFIITWIKNGTFSSRFSSRVSKNLQFHLWDFCFAQPGIQCFRRFCFSVLGYSAIPLFLHSIILLNNSRCCDSQLGHFAKLAALLGFKLLIQMPKCSPLQEDNFSLSFHNEIGRASCRERV